MRSLGPSLPYLFAFLSRVARVFSASKVLRSQHLSLFVSAHFNRPASFPELPTRFATLALAVGLLAGNSAIAQTCTVTDNSDSPSDSGSLRYCVNNAVSGETINFASSLNGQTIILIPSNGPLAINTSLTIQGPGANLLTISGGNAVGVFQIKSGAMSISGLTIANGYSPLAGSGGGGGIYSNGGALTVNNITFSGNRASDGGGILSYSALTVSNSTFSGNSVTGGGGAILAAGGTLTVSNSTFSGNSTLVDSGGGGAIYSFQPLMVTNSTFYGNSASLGGGIFVEGGGSSTLMLSNSTFFGNGGGAVYNNYSTLMVSNSILASGDTCLGGGCPTNGSNGNVVGASNVNLLPLGYYGGPTQTMLPQPGSTAICAGSDALVPAGVTTDQRGFPLNSSCVDAGAVQSNYLTVTTVADVTDGSPNCSGGTGDTCSLRDAMNAGNSSGYADIAFASDLNGGTITLASALPSITGLMNLIGPGASNLTVSGNNSSSVSTVLTVDSSAAAFLYGLTVANGYAPEYSIGGGISNSGKLTVSTSAISNNYAIEGGGLTNSGTLTLSNSTVSGNSAWYGGGIFNSYVGTVTLNNSTVVGNLAYQDGGINNAGALTVNSSSVSGNHANDGGGGIGNNGSLTLTNSIVAGNTAPSFALYADIVGSYMDNGGNLASNNSSPTSTIAINLSPLGNYGGQTQTVVPLPGSPAICAGLAANIRSGVTTDQRGYPNGNTTYTGYSSGSPCVDSGAVQSQYTSVQFVQQPTNTLVNAAISPPPTMQVLETNANQTTNNTDAVNGIPITLGFSGGSGEISGTLTETTTGGVATFGGLTPNTAGTGFTLSTSVPVIAGTSLTATSNGFNVNTVQASTATTTANVSTPFYYPAYNVTLSANVTSAVGTVNEGTVNFTVGTLNLTASGAVVNGTATGTVIVPTDTYPGVFPVTAAFAGTPNFTASADSGHAFTIVQASTTTTLTSSLTPSGYGQPITLTAAIVNYAGVSPLTGSVTFLDGTTSLGNVAISGAQATLTVSLLAAGIHSLTAQYSGSATCSGSTSAVLTQTIMPSVTTTQPSVSFGAVAVGASTGSTQTLTFTVPSGITLGGISAVTQGAQHLDFTLTGGTCASGTTATTCTVQVQFVATAVGARLGAVVLTDQSSNTLITVPLQGTGTGPLVAFGPSPITTYAGTGTAGYTGDGGPASAAEINAPRGVAMDSTGNLYFSDSNNSVIRKITPRGTITTVAGNGTAGYNGDNIPATSAELSLPHGLVVDGTGNLYIADTDNNRIRMVTPGGTITTVAGNGYTVPNGINGGYNGDNIPATSAELNLPLGVAVDGAGNLYIADQSNHRIREVTTSGIITTVAGTGVPGYNGDNIAATSAELNYATGVAVDGTGDLYIADEDNLRVRMVSPSGVITTVAGNGYFTGSGTHGDGGPAISAELDRPISVTLDAASNLYIADVSNARVREVSPSGIITTVAGTGTAGYNGDNIAATTAELKSPLGVVVDGAGNLYIADQSNLRIRRIDVSDPPSLNFAGTNVGSTSTSQDVTVLNLGNVPLNISQISTTVNFSLGGADTSCSSSNQTLIPVASCVLGIEFSPTASGSTSGSVVLADNALNASTATQTIVLQGQGVGSAGPATIASPVSGSTLTGASTTFTWTSSGYTTPVYLWIGSTLGGNDLVNVGPLSGTSTTVTLPTSGDKVYATLWSTLSGNLVSSTATYTEFSALPAAIQTPANGGTLSAAATTFTWVANQSTTPVYLWIGSTSGGNDLVNVGPLSGTSTTVTLPTSGNKVYATLWSTLNGNLVSTTASYTEVSLLPASISTPASGSTLSGAATTFTWAANGSTTPVYLWVGSASGGNDLANVGPLSGTSTTVNLPTNGAPVYATLWSTLNGNLVSTTAAYSEATLSAASISTPASGSTLSGTSTTITWTANGSTAPVYLWIGSTAGGNDLVNVGPLSGTSTTVNLPTNGATVYVTLWSTLNGNLVSTTASYTEASVLPATIVSPASGGTVSGQTTFTWVANQSTTPVYLWVGSTSGGNDEVNLGPLSGTSVTVTLPTDGNPVYVTLWSTVNGNLVSSSVAYNGGVAPDVRKAAKPVVTIKRR
jgi:sugar lactone lactonase YvrE